MYIMVIEKIREPSWITASAVFPIMMTAALYVTETESLDVRVFCTLLGYVVFQLCIGMVGVYFLGRRESGFLKAFVVHGDAKHKYYLNELLSCLACGSAHLIILSALIGIAYVDRHLELVSYTLRAVVVFFFMFPLFSLYNLIPFSFQQVLQATSVVSAPLLILALWGGGAPEGSIIQSVNIVNPVHLSSVFIYGGAQEGIEFVIVVALLSVLTIVLLKSRLSVSTYWDR